MKRTLILASALIVGGCGDTTVSHDLEARRAFVGLDDAELFTVEPALELLGVDAVSAPSKFTNFCSTSIASR